MATYNPLVLGFDTSTAACRIALTYGDEILGQCDEAMSKGQAEHLMPLCQRLMSEAGVVPGDLSAIGVGIGPGNFTGIRISVAAARGMALGLGVPAIGVSTFEALRQGERRECVCTVDARRGDVYAQECDRRGPVGSPVLQALAGLLTENRYILGHGGARPAFPIPVAICRAAAAKLSSPQPRPAPLYIRPADAAPGRDTPPRILP